MLRLLLSLLVALVAVQDPAAAEVRRLAFVQGDGTLEIGRRTVRLYGIYIPPTDRVCRTGIRPVRCGSRAVLQLDLRVDRFVACDRMARYADGSESAVCRVRDRNSPLGPEVDLSAWMLYHGWAVALPGAPFEYLVLERIARERGRGVWGFPADRVTFR
jgi:endonuclease YncB( thermonuclease family)